MALALAAVLGLVPLAAAAGDGGGPRGVVTALETQTMEYPNGVQVSYLEPVNCTLEFDEEVVNFNESALELGQGTILTNFVAVSESAFTFQLSSAISTNLSVSIPPTRAVGASGDANNVTTGAFGAEFFAYPPSATLRLDGYVGQRTKKLSNLAYIVFNSTTIFNGLNHFDVSLVSLSPFLEISNFARVGDRMVKFNFEIPTRAPSGPPTCVEPNASLPSAEHSHFTCSHCDRSERCMSDTIYPPSDVNFLEFPFEVHIDAVPSLGLAASTLPFFYDTLWAELRVEAPAFAKGAFPVTVAWSEPMHEPFAALTFGAGGPTVDEEQLRMNRTILNSSAFQVLVEPAGTGILSIFVNGTKDTRDLAYNSNDFRLNPSSRTGGHTVVVFSDGPPLEGQIAFEYARHSEAYEYGALPMAAATTPSMTVSWSGFVTAVGYDFWMTWGDESSPVFSNLTATSYIFPDFKAQLGVEYTAHVRAFNMWGDSVIVSRKWLHPTINVVADGSYDFVSLPTFMSPMHTNVTFDMVIGKQAFLSMNPVKVVSVRSIDRTAGDAEPCNANSDTMRCTDVNFHIEVPSTQFLVFRNPLRVQLTFGRSGWDDEYFRPQLRYWEAFREEWRPAADSCPPSQAFEQWNDFFKIYKVNVCHLSQFSVFELYSPPTTTAPPTEIVDRDTVEDPEVVAALGGGMALMFVVVTACYLACTRPWKKPSFPGKARFKSWGIKSMPERLPKRKYSEEGFECSPPVGRRSDSSDDEADVEAATTELGSRLAAIEDTQGLLSSTKTPKESFSAWGDSASSSHDPGTHGQRPRGGPKRAGSRYSDGGDPAASSSGAAPLAALADLPSSDEEDTQAKIVPERVEQAPPPHIVPAGSTEDMLHLESVSPRSQE